MNFRISPLWWPILGLSSPVVLPYLIKKNKEYKQNLIKSFNINSRRIENTDYLNLPEIESLEVTTLIEWKTKKDFLGDAGVSYLFKTERGSLLFDVGHGPENNALLNNSKKLNFSLNQIDELVISHLHKDHIGGMNAMKEKNIKVPRELLPDKKIPCYLPDNFKADGFVPNIIDKPKILKTGIATTGPLARSLYLLGFTEEQALIINLKNKGLVIFTGCGHPTIQVIIKMVKKISNIPIYAIGGGLHFPITKGRGSKAGIEFQQVLGTGKPPWKRINTDDLEETIETINMASPQKVFLSGHDSCDYSLEFLSQKLNSETQILKAGESFKL